MSTAQTLYEKIWNAHLIEKRDDGSCLLFVDRHMINEGSSVQAFDGLRQRGIKVARSEMHLAIADHLVPTRGREALRPGRARDLIEMLERNCRTSGITYLPIDHGRHGICHVVAPELGFVLPGMLAVCGDSHTATLGALGAIGVGIGTSEVEHVLATGTLVQHRSKTFAIQIDGTLCPGVTSKDMILSIIGKIGAGSGTGYALEYKGSAIAALSIEARLSLCNMSIEAGARVGMIAPDEKTLAWLAGRCMAPQGAAWQEASTYWRTLISDYGAVYDRVTHLDATAMVPQVTWGTSPEHVVGVTGVVPHCDDVHDSATSAAYTRALDYQGLQPGTAIVDIPIDRVFIGSCTNARLSDLRDAADFVRGRHLASHVEGFVVPGSAKVKEQAEAQGLDRVFREAGFEWRYSGCSMCCGGDAPRPHTRVAATSNRNFENRQGRQVRTHLVSPAMAAAAGIAGHFVDIRAIERVPA